MKTLNVASEFSPFPAGRYVTDGPFPGEKFRGILVEALKLGRVTVELDGTFGYGSSFLEEAFGGLVRKCGFTAKTLRELLVLKSSDPSVEEEVWSYINDAKPEKRRE